MSVWEDFYRHAALFFSLRPSSRQREGACHVNRIITSQSPLQRAALPPWLPICTAEHRCQGRAARRSRFLDCGGLLCCTDKYGGNWNMKNQYSRMDNICPKEPRKLRIPDQIDLYMEDGTIYHVRSFFTGDLMMGDVLDALTMEKLERAQ